MTGAPRGDVVAPFRRWGAAWLVVAVVAGSWMRGILMGQPWTLGSNFTYDRHAHSHVAFFGWVTLGIMGAIAGALPAGRVRAGRLRGVAHAIGVLAGLAFVSFLHGGYDGASIALSFLHVVLWVVFTAMVWRALGGVAAPARGFYRGALFMLCLAGASTMGPAVVLATHQSDPWIREVTVKLFLAIFIGGWMGLGVMGIGYARLDAPRFARPALVLTLAGAVPAALLHATATPPAAWLLVVGRAGTLLLGLGALGFAIDLLRAPALPALLRAAGVAVLVQGTLQVLAGAGVGATLMRGPSIVIAYLHLVLVGVVTPVLLTGLGLARRAALATATLAIGLALMLLALVAMGWPALGTALGAAGADTMTLLRVAFAGGVLAAAGVIILSWRLLSSRA